MKKNIIITILAILVLGMGGYLVYDKILSKDDKVEKETIQDKQEEYTLIDKDNASIQFLYSIRRIGVFEFDKALYTTEYLEVKDRTQEDKYSIASILFEKSIRNEFQNDTTYKEVVANEDVKNAYERIFGPNTYTTPETIISYVGKCLVYNYDKNNDYFVADGGCGGAYIRNVDENIDEVRKYNDKIEIKTSYYFFEDDAGLGYTQYYSDSESKNLITKLNNDSTVNIFEEYKDQLNHMTYTYKLGEDGFYYYYSSQMDK